MRGRAPVRLLDFGCGYGEFIAMCDLYGFEAYGIDRSSAKRENGRFERILPGLLQYGDTVSMANGIESRLPFLDYRLVEFCARLPIEWKIRNGQTKYILREYLRRIKQTQIANRKDKKGYPTPIEQLFKYNDGELLRELLLSQHSRISAYCDQSKIQDLLTRYLAGQKRSENPLYRLLSAELWLQECIPASNFETLANT